MVPRRKEEIPVLWDDLDDDDVPTHIVLTEKFSGKAGARPRAQVLSIADFETVRIPRSALTPNRACERFLDEENVDTVARAKSPELRRVIDAAGKMPPKIAPPPLPVIPAWGKPADPLAPTDLAFVPLPAREPVEAPPAAAQPRRRRSLIPWATLFIGFVVGAGLFSDAVKAGHVRRAIDVIAAFVDPALDHR